MTARRIFGDVIGRQPDRPVIVPSKPCAWYGWPVEGEALTDTQLATLAERGRKLAEVEVIQVHREATFREMYWPTGTPPPVYRMPCPVLTHHADGRVKVVAPNGEAKLVARAPADFDSDTFWAAKPRGVRRYG